MKDKKLHAMFTPTPSSNLGKKIIKIGDGDEFSWYQSHIEAWEDRELEEHLPVPMHNNTGWAVPTMCILLDSQSKMDLIAIPKMLVNIQKVQYKKAIWVQCKSGNKVFNQVGEIPGYVTVWYEPTGIANIISMSRVKRKYQVVFICEGRNYFRMVLPDREIRFQLIPNRLYYFNAIDWENTVLFFNMVTDNMEVFMWQ